MDEKRALRDRAWGAIRDAGAARFPGVEGRIPNFVGAEDAARLLESVPEWKAARAVKANPDSPQLPVRKAALRSGKTVFMAVPKLAGEQPFWRLDPDELMVPIHKAASISGAASAGVPVDLDEMDRIDLIVCGSVAVERSGARLGKGGGYSDLEFAIGVEAGLIGPWTTIATTVHACQIVEDGAIPVTEHDFPLDIIVTPDEVIMTSTGLSRPSGVIDDDLDVAKRAAIPVLARRGSASR